MWKKLLLCLLCLAMLIPAALAESAKLRAVVDYLWISYETFEGLPVEIEESSKAFSDMADAFAMRNDQIDLFVFPASDGLFSVKKHGYYAPLNDSEALMTKLQDFYPAAQRALTNDNGDLVGWIVGGGVMGMLPRQGRLLEEVGLTMPTTFEELLDFGLALIEADVMPGGLSIISDTPFTKKDMLDLYMDQYIRASQLEGSTVDFTAPGFVALVERIRSELPDVDPAFEGMYPNGGVIDYPIGFSSLDADMIPMVSVLPDKTGLVDSYPSIIVVNPYSARKDEAVAFIEKYFVDPKEALYMFDASLNEPTKSDYILRKTEMTAQRIAELEALEEMTLDERDELDELYVELEMWQNSWSESPEAIAAYAAISGSLSITEASPVTYDAQLKVAVERFLGGAFDAEGFARECQDHINMIYMENDIPMK